MKHSLKACAVAAASTLAMVGAYAAPTSVLLYDDFIYNGQDTWGDALNGLGLSVTRVSSDGAFSSTLTSTSFDLVVVQFDSTGHSINGALSSYVSGGGKAIYGHWLSQNDTVFGVTAGASNAPNMTITASWLAAGLSSANPPLHNPTYGIYTRSFTGLGGGTSLASFGADSAVVLAANGHAIVNGPLGNTFVNSSDEVRFYQNEVTHLTAAVPEPEQVALVLAGLVTVSILRSRRKA